MRVAYQAATSVDEVGQHWPHVVDDAFLTAVELKIVFASVVALSHVFYKQKVETNKLFYACE